MTSEKFVEAFYNEKQNFLNEYLSGNSGTEVSLLIKSLNLDLQQVEVLKKVLDQSFTDIFYTILLGLDGSASIGGVQENYSLKDENGNLLNGGTLEGFAYEYFIQS